MSNPGVRFQHNGPRFLALAFLASLCITFSMQARTHRRHADQPPGSFSYYMLVLSYAPDFCAEPAGDKDPRECGAGRHVGFVVHGLWPQNNTGRGPENCGSASPVSQSIIRATLPYIPTESLIQHEWLAHGTCSGLDAASYFAALRKARDSVRIPSDLNQPGRQVQLSPAQIETMMAKANPSFNPEAFRISCYRDDSLQEVRICLNKDLSSRVCTASAAHCNASAVTLLPVR